MTDDPEGGPDLSVVGVWVVRLTAGSIALVWAATATGIAWRAFTTLAGI